LGGCIPGRGKGLVQSECKKVLRSHYLVAREAFMGRLCSVADIAPSLRISEIKVEAGYPYAGIRNTFLEDKTLPLWTHNLVLFSHKQLLNGYVLIGTN
jgi:hypothetical protein